MLMLIGPDVKRALDAGEAVVALESTVISHGLPYPDNLKVARQMEQAVRAQGAIPATIAILGGEPVIGLDDARMEYLAQSKGMRKCSPRDVPIVMAKGLDGATTVAGTMILAHRAGIRVFATGGIGGVHRGHPFDVSADLEELARTPMVVPAFYSRESGLLADARVEGPEEVVAIARARNDLGLQAALLVAVPVPAGDELPREEAEAAIARALRIADEMGIQGAGVTPFLLARIAELTGGRSVQANLSLLANNARLAGRIARA
ncbi:MAG: pseudouridine-5-phosphate glycosidase, partial [Anaerolineae bacterium SM23_84]